MIFNPPLKQDVSGARYTSTPPNKNFINSSTYCKKTAKEAFGSVAQKFIDKAIYAKMPDHVKKILNRTYLEAKPYSDIVLHLEREMRLNGLSAPDETTLFPPNTVDAVVTDDKIEQQQRVIVFTAANKATIKHSVADLGKSDTMPPQKRTPRIQTKTKHQNPSVTRVAKCTKARTAGTELMRQMTPGRKNNENSSSQQIRSVNIPYLTT